MHSTAVGSGGGRRRQEKRGEERWIVGEAATLTLRQNREESQKRNQGGTPYSTSLSQLGLGLGNF